ncbi:MAG TPA: protein kinase [Candidatus Krumholzibacteria bacterium]|nr:protein kinase [Candidatus Krumholzibacteria bacterium]
MPSGRTLHPGDRIARYRIIGPLGAGGMGEVYLADDLSLERKVALKILPPELVRSEERVRRFVLEAKSASSLNHPNIVTIYEIGQESVLDADGSPRDPGAVHYISMELVSGKTLSDLIHDGTDLRTLLGYLAQVADGLAKAHAAGIVHRDLKPSNIMVSGDGFAKVLDFGLAKLTESRTADASTTNAQTMATDRTSDGAVLGTAGYMSPEQVQGKNVDHRSDIFALGCMLYEAGTGKHPFAAETGVETMTKILRQEPAPIDQLNAAVPAELRRIIRRCLAKNPEQRLQSMKDIAIELRDIVDEFDSLSASASSGSGILTTPALPPARRGLTPRRLAVLTAVGMAVIVAVGLEVMRERRRESQSPAPAALRILTQTNRGDVVECVLSQDGRYLGYSTQVGGRSSLRVRQVATGSDVEVLPLGNQALSGLRFTPDGNYLFFLQSKPDTPNYSSLMQVASLGGTPRERAFDVDSRVSFSPDGRQFVFHRGVPQKNMDTIVWRDLESGEERTLATLPRPKVYNGGPSWSPDGKLVVASEFEQGASGIISTLVVYRVEDGRREVVRVDKAAVLTAPEWLADGSGFVATGADLAGVFVPQIFLIDRDGRHKRLITNDLTAYNGVSVSSASDVIASTRALTLANLWIATVDGEAARQITSVTNPENSPGGVQAGNGEHIFFNAIHEGLLQLWSLEPGGAPRVLTTNAGFVTNFVPYTTGVAFQRLEPAGDNHVWTMKPDGSGVRQLTSGTSELLLDVSNDGSCVSFARRDSVITVYTVPAAGGEPVLVSTQAWGELGLVSPDGTRIILVAPVQREAILRTEFRVFSASGGSVLAAFVLPPQGNDVAWCPDGNSITFRDRELPGFNLYRLRFDGTPPQQITHFTEGRGFEYAWSPDGANIAIERILDDGVENVWVVDAEGHNPRQLTQFQSGIVFAIEWMADNRRLVVKQGQRSRDAALVRNFR